MRLEGAFVPRDKDREPQRGVQGSAWKVALQNFSIACPRHWRVYIQTHVEGSTLKVATGWKAHPLRDL